MRFFKKKQPEKKILYQKFKSNQMQDSNENASVKKPEKTLKGSNLNQTITIAICSIDGHMGSSYISRAIAYYIRERIKKTVCIVDIYSQSQVIDENDIATFPLKNLYDLYDKYKYIILDCSTKNLLSLEIKNEVKRADKKILISLPDEKLEPVLADFIRGEEVISKWTFVFNLVPKSKKNYIFELMEDYKWHCFSSFDINKLDKETNRTIAELMKR